MMSAYSPCILVNDTATCSFKASSSPVGLAVGLTLLFLLLGVSAGLIIYKKRRKLRNMLQLGHGNAQNKDDHTQTPQTDSHQYTCVITTQSEGQTPIYENLSVQVTSRNTTVVHQDR